LQEGVMKTRMQPIGNAWQKLPRIVRDLSLSLDKKIDLEMIGAETELDRQVLEVINLARFGAVSSNQAVHLYQQFSLLLAVLGHSSSILAFLRDHYHEEFK